MTEPTPEDRRVRFAGERTLLAWVRTGLALMGFGFVVARFGVFLHELASFQAEIHTPPTTSTSLSIWLGVAFLILGVAVMGLAAVEHAVFLRRLARGEPFRPSRWSLGIVVTAVLSAGGVALAGYLIRIHP